MRAGRRVIAWKVSNLYVFIFINAEQLSYWERLQFKSSTGGMVHNSPWWQCLNIEIELDKANFANSSLNKFRLLDEFAMKWWWWWWLVRNQGLATKWAFPYVWNWTESLSSRWTLLLQQNQSQSKVFPWNHFSLAVTRVGSGNQQWQIATRKVNKRAMHGQSRSILGNVRSILGLCIA